MKRLTKMLISGTLIVSMGMTAAAASFNLRIKNPYTSSLTSTGLMEVTGSQPYVYPKVATPPTGYILSPKRFSTQEATNIIVDVTTPGKRFFTYQPNYGGAGSSYCLSAFPRVSSFNDYSVNGEWSA